MVEDDPRFAALQESLGLLLPSTAPKAAFDEGRELLEALQRCGREDFEREVEKFKAWAALVRANFD